MVKGTLRAYVALGIASLLGAAVACNSVLGIDSAILVGADGGGGGGGGSCATYCAAMQRNCTGAFQEYIDLGTCLAMCQNLEPGTPGDTTQDSLSCRTHFADLAATDPATNCRSAGPLGTGSCGNAPCTAYCTLVEAFCTSPPPYSSAVACVAACQNDFPYLLDAGDIALSSGDTLNCRTYHLESAYEPANPQAKATHCPHTGVISATCFNAAPADAGVDSGLPGIDASDDGG